MKKFLIYAFLAVMPVVMISCSDDEEILEPTVGYLDNEFAVSADATGPEAEMRRDFYASTGINLLYSEVLSREYVGLDAFGDEVWKENKVDFRYNLTSMSDMGPEFVEFESIEDKKAAAEFVEQYIYPHLEGSRLKPFSMLLVESLQKPDRYNEYLEDADYYSCWRCYAIAVGKCLSMTDEEKQAYASTVLMDIVLKKFDVFCDEMDPFYELSDEFAEERIIKYDEDWDRSDMTIVYEKGYLDFYADWADRYERDMFRTSYGSDDDFEDFYEAIMSRDENDFMEEFGDYDRIVSKYKIVKDCILSFGYKF